MSNPLGERSSWPVDSVGSIQCVEDLSLIAVHSMKGAAPEGTKGIRLSARFKSVDCLAPKSPCTRAAMQSQTARGDSKVFNTCRALPY